MSTIVWNTRRLKKPQAYETHFATSLKLRAEGVGGVRGGE